MQASDIRNPSERKKLILAAALGLVAILFLWWTFFGFGSSSNTPTPRAANQPTPATQRGPTTRPLTSTQVEPAPIDLNTLKLIPVNFWPVGAPEARRNIFAFYVPPVVVKAVPVTPTPTPTPTPPILLARLSPPNVYAKTGDFTLEVAGDKFSPQLHVTVDNSELPTRFIGPQQLATTVPASMIANPGARQVMLRTSDGKIYSNTLSLSVADPPKPNYSYIGIYGTQKRIADTAILLDKSSKDTLNVQRGDLVGGRFRITSISEKELVLVDNTLKIKHTLPMTVQGDRSGPTLRPTPRVESEDDEP